MKSTLLFTHDDRLKNRPVSFKEVDEQALHAIVQAAVNVELFTIPLYMTSLYSLQGMHEINSKGNNFYLGRTWPGMAATAKPATANEKAFNAVFSVFVAEMLHLQIVSNLAKVIGYEPKFTCEPLQDEQTYAWKCYGDDKTVLPHILDFKDCIAPFDKVKVKTGAMNKEQVRLFLAIEQTETDAEKVLDPDKIAKYSEKAPFDNWKPGTDLPLFGSIGNMYLQLWNYLSITYTDGVTLWDIVFEKGKAGSDVALQKEIFNPERLNPKLAPDPKDPGDDEYPGIATSIQNTESEAALLDAMNMINGITDQGEGGGVIKQILDRMNKSRGAHEHVNLSVVQDQFRPSCPVLKNKYPSFTATGADAPSAKADARDTFGKMDHFETFAFVMNLLMEGQIETWDQWHAKGNSWSAESLQTAAYDPTHNPQLPPSGDIAGALNRLKLNDTANAKNFELFSRASTGAIAGVTKVLNDYFKNPKTQFPYPSMGGSGDRMSICWAIFGKAPDISLGVTSPDDKPIDRTQHLYHACQGMSLDDVLKDNPETCATTAIYHTCKGSNDCKTEGGCGFVQKTTGGGLCGGKATAFYKTQPGWPAANALPFSPPADNACKALGGCAVPISASQMYPAVKDGEEYRMQLYDFGDKPGFKPKSFGILDYEKGELVYDVAWKAYRAVLEKRGLPVPEKPKPSDLRLAFPPST
ncbi:ferritin-like domain-containing protein [Mucilaginibacter sp. OK283]|uniref:ferritin-like domain-containing protein n=1 Tax=Mucilaginibacter sp. OK283 TaxID=1881049 RepID=UPI0008BBCB24|nr:ferritin-like domain-containing protein [Mucilaginibacter sp. OK283]SEP32923.1 Ferritin-like [Mucilaginibacter sp. OK283]